VGEAEPKLTSKMFCMAMLVGPLLAVIIFYSRNFNTSNKITVSDALVALVPSGFQILFLAISITGSLYTITPLFVITSASMLALGLFLHILPYTGHLISCVTGRPTTFDHGIPQKSILSSFEDMGMMTDDEVEKMLLSPKKHARGDI
jgi:hypothetical protein